MSGIRATDEDKRLLKQLDLNRFVQEQLRPEGKGPLRVHHLLPFAPPGGKQAFLHGRVLQGRVALEGLGRRRRGPGGHHRACGTRLQRRLSRSPQNTPLEGIPRGILPTTIGDRETRQGREDSLRETALRQAPQGEQHRRYQRLLPGTGSDVSLPHGLRPPQRLQGEEGLSRHARPHPVGPHGPRVPGAQGRREEDPGSGRALVSRRGTPNGYSSPRASSIPSPARSCSETGRYRSAPSTAPPT